MKNILRIFVAISSLLVMQSNAYVLICIQK